MPSDNNYSKEDIEYLLEDILFEDIDNILDDWNDGNLSDDDCIKYIQKTIDESEDDDSHNGIVNDFYENVDNILLALDDEEIYPEDAILDIDDLLFEFKENEMVKDRLDLDHSLDTIETIEDHVGEKKQWKAIKKKIKKQEDLEPQQEQYLDEKIEQYKQIQKKKRAWRIMRIQKLLREGIGQKSRWESMLDMLKKDKEPSLEDLQYFKIKSKEERRGIISTTHTIEGYEIVSYLDIVSGHTVIGLMFLKDAVIGLTDFFGGRSGIIERNLRTAQEIAIKQMTANSKKIGGDAVIGVTFDFSPITRDNKPMLMVAATGTAVVLRPKN